MPWLSLKPYALHAGKKGACSAEIGALTLVFKKSATELKHKQKLLQCKSSIHIVTFNFRTLNRIDQLPDRTASVVEHDIVCVQKHRYYHNEVEIKYHNTGSEWTFISASAWKNSVNATIEGVRIHLGPHTLKSVNSIKKIQLRMMFATFNGNSSTTIISCYSPTNASDETTSITSYPSLSVESLNTTC